MSKPTAEERAEWIYNLCCANYHDIAVREITVALYAHAAVAVAQHLSAPDVVAFAAEQAEQARVEERARLAQKVDDWCDVPNPEHRVCTSVFHRIATAIRRQTP